MSDSKVCFIKYTFECEEHEPIKTWQKVKWINLSESVDKLNRMTDDGIEDYCPICRNVRVKAQKLDVGTPPQD